ncbi:MAG TPA: hypothetical protein DDZ83_05445 [Nitrospinae bacterium]|nr:hypothetical protein [Nitrospinota bacterium]
MPLLGKIFLAALDEGFLPDLEPGARGGVDLFRLGENAIGIRGVSTGKINFRQAAKKFDEAVFECGLAASKSPCKRMFLAKSTAWTIGFMASWARSRSSS